MSLAGRIHLTSLCSKKSNYENATISILTKVSIWNSICMGNMNKIYIQDIHQHIKHTNTHYFDPYRTRTWDDRQKVFNMNKRTADPINKDKIKRNKLEIHKHIITYYTQNQILVQPTEKLIHQMVVRINYMYPRTIRPTRYFPRAQVD